MLNQLLQQLETKITDATDTIQLLVLDNDELKDMVSALSAENVQLKANKAQWEQNLSTMLQKFNPSDLATMPKEGIFKPDLASLDTHART